ncbi:hypothetical protein P3T76_009719 [Phytophthora citrophthora]|uniref:Uncharacterized protein n=1 Tax=Phytophthora citrophthora TaxID=4793 RepID=A0AAD9GED6_9STRA|nr:hypothetical protein P3T76_009719 [Phytophthora citrophthora]
MDRKRSRHSAGRRGNAAIEATEPTFRREGSWKHRSSSVLWLKLNFTIKTARLQTLKRQKYQHLQEEALLKAKGLLKNWEDGPVVLTEDLYSGARSEHDAQEILNYTPEALVLRFSLRNHPDVIAAVKQLWSVELPRDEMGCIDQKGYASLFRRIGRSLEPDATKRRLRRMEKTIKEDWLRDSRGEDTMGFANFFDSVFELADLWCETIDVEEYTDFLRRLVQRVSALRRNKRDPNDEGRRMLRNLKQIRAIDDDEESESESDDSPGEIDDEEELSSGGSDDDDDEEEENGPIPLPPPVARTNSIGFKSSKLLQSARKTPPSSAGSSQIVPEVENSPLPGAERLRERRASIITLGDFELGGLGGFNGFPYTETEEPKTTNEIRASSAKSRVASAKSKTPLTTVRENIIAVNVDEGVNALVAMHRSRSAQPRVVEDTGINSISNAKVSLNVGIPMVNSPPRQQKPSKLTGSKAGLGVGSVSMDGIPASGGLHNATTSSTSQLKTSGLNTGGIGTFGDIETARAGTAGARKAILSSKSKPKGDKKPGGILFDDIPQANTRLAALEVASSTGNSRNISDTHRTRGKNGFWIEENDETGLQLRNLNNNQSSSQVPREYISGMGFENPGAANMDTLSSSIQTKADILPVNSTSPFYTFDETASPAKRLLPPVQDDTGNRGRSGAYSGNSKVGQQHSADNRANQGLDFTDSYKTTGYLTGSLQAEILSRNRSNSRKSGLRELQGATPLWLSLPGKDSRFQSRHNSSTKRMKKIQVDDGLEGTVSPWDTEFDADEDLARVVPHRISPGEKNLDIPTEILSSVGSKDRSPELSALEPPTLSVSSSMVTPEPPSCVSELTTLPHEYHELVLGGSAFSYSSLTRTETAPAALPSTSTQIQPVNPVQMTLREQQWMLQGTSQSTASLLENGVEGRTVAGSPRSVLTPLASKRPRHDHEEDDLGLCARCVEHLGDRSATAPPIFRPDRSRPRCKCREDGYISQDQHCHCHGNNWQEEVPVEEDVTVIVNATRGLILRPGTMDQLAAKRAKYKQQATRSEMMRRRCQYTFAKHLS